MYDILIDSVMLLDFVEKLLQSNNAFKTERLIAQSNPKHTANVISNYLQWTEKQGDLEVIIWPFQSPDLNRSLSGVT